MIQLILKIFVFICLIGAFLSFYKKVKPIDIKSRRGLFYPFTFLLVAFLLLLISNLIITYG